MSYVLAVDVGGTKLAAALVDEAGRLTGYRRMATPSGPYVGADDLWRALVELLDEVTGRVVPVGVGVGCGGPMIWPDGDVSPLNIPSWRRFPLRARLADRYPGVPVRVHNDAVCVAVAEHWRGAGKGHRNVLGMVVSTGVGGGLILDDRLITGASGNAGHVGHIVVEPEGPPCACGGRGCLEAVARGPGLVAWAQAHGWRTGEEMTGVDLAADARRGVPSAVRALRRAGGALGVAIASATHLCDLDVVAIGGGLSQAGAPLFGPLAAALRAHARMPFAARVEVVPAALGQGAGLVGAAALILAGDRYWPAP
ncbi:ROK family protein [Actinomadura rayongensis]|uniref:ROK family protein n=1 Tax=Actinomadura rayongensis TaxID=1429076 RepID=A0A6I4W5W0_9ACTN|nr:ROK family protein [Actinomadura rayongensis]MXQ66109.1 ROK family protein [Actinomadura rayongensis]